MIAFLRSVYGYKKADCQHWQSAFLIIENNRYFFPTLCPATP